MSITFKEEVNVFDGNEFIGRIEKKPNYAPIFFPIPDDQWFSAKALQSIADKLDELDRD